MNSIIITGANSGIGYECALHMAKIAPNEQLILACRNMEAGKQALKEIQQKTGHKHAICLSLDLASFKSIEQFRDSIANLTNPKIEALVNNAGVSYIGKPRYTKEGFELTFGTNHLGNLYLTLLLLPYMDSNGSITFTASGTHDPKQKTGMPAPKFEDPNLLAYPVNITNTAMNVGQTRYTTSKLCNILTTYELQQKLINTNIRVNAFDPGLVPGTGLTRAYSPVIRVAYKCFFKVASLFVSNINSAKKSGKRLANLAYSIKYKNAKGKYFEGEKEIKSSEESYNKAHQKQLWNGSIKLLDIKEKEIGLLNI